MKAKWEDVNARASGLGTHLLSAGDLADLARAPDLPALARALAALGILPEEVPRATAPLLELALRRAAAREVAVLRRWLGSRADVVAVALEAEDRRSLRALVRGAAAGAHAEARLSGLLPTPALPERLLRELAARSNIREQAALLLAAGHPAGAALLQAASGQEPNLFMVEQAISRVFALRATKGARRGGPVLREYVGDLIDGDNCRAALLLAGRRGGESPGPAFIEGGRRVGRELFERAATAADAETAARLLSQAFAGEAQAGLVRRHAGDAATLETAWEERMTARLERAARLDPLGPAPFLLYLRRLRDQSVALGDLVWALDLGVPRRRAAAG